FNRRFFVSHYVSRYASQIFRSISNLLGRPSLATQIFSSFQIGRRIYSTRTSRLISASPFRTMFSEVRLQISESRAPVSMSVRNIARASEFMPANAPTLSNLPVIQGTENGGRDRFFFSEKLNPSKGFWIVVTP